MQALWTVSRHGMGSQVSNICEIGKAVTGCGGFVLVCGEGLEEQGRYSDHEYNCECNQEVSDPQVDSNDYEVPEPDR